MLFTCLTTGDQTRTEGSEQVIGCLRIVKQVIDSHLVHCGKSSPSPASPGRRVEQKVRLNLVSWLDQDWVLEVRYWLIVVVKVVNDTQTCVLLTIADEVTTERLSQFVHVHSVRKDGDL